MKTSTLLKAGESCVISRDTTDNPKLCGKRLSNGRTSLYLQYYLGYHKETDPVTGKQSVKVIRRKESLSLYLYSDPRTPDKREYNKNAIEVAKRIRYEREQERLETGSGYRVRRRSRTDFLQYFRDYCDSYTKKDKDILKLAYTRFIDFLKSSPKYRPFSTGIQPRQLTEDMVREYAGYLQTRGAGGGPATIYAHFKKVVKHAAEHDIFAKNPCTGISIRADNSLTKDILSMEEIRTLVGTPFPSIHVDIRRAFLFSLYTGIRFCDVKELTFGNVDYSRQVLTFMQHKTEGRSAHSNVTIPLNASALSLVGERGGKDERIFHLLTFSNCLRVIQKWVDAAGIDKHITWHCARHSFAVNILNNGANIKTVSSLLGHSSISMTEKYLHAVDHLKRAAVDSLPDLNL